MVDTQMPAAPGRAELADINPELAEPGGTTRRDDLP